MNGLAIVQRGPMPYVVLDTRREYLELARTIQRMTVYSPGRDPKELFMLEAYFDMMGELALFPSAYFPAFEQRLEEIANGPEILSRDVEDPDEVRMITRYYSNLARKVFNDCRALFLFDSNGSLPYSFDHWAHGALVLRQMKVS